jgi:hypothetical protein
MAETQPESAETQPDDKYSIHVRSSTNSQNNCKIQNYKFTVRSRCETMTHLHEMIIQSAKSSVSQATQYSDNFLTDDITLDSKE